MEIRKTRLLYWDGKLPEISNHLRTPSGTSYTVLNFKPNTRPNPKSIGSMTLLKLSEDDVNNLPDDTVFLRFKWTNRNKKEI